MFKLRFRLPSPALVVSMVTLSLVLGGTAVAATTATHKDARADSVLVKKLAPSLSVKHAKSARRNQRGERNQRRERYARDERRQCNQRGERNQRRERYARDERRQRNQRGERNQRRERYARDERRQATNATTAQTANVAKAIGAVTYVKGTVRDAPANGGSGFAESTESDAFCPAGTVVIGTASHANDQGVEASEVLLATTTQVAGFFDNFNNIDEPNNFVIAICAAASSVNDPSGF